ncbi:MAG TPA: hypothetical protein VIL37_06460 [Natronosporangium sp.]
MQDAWRAYLELALGLTEASRKKAKQAVQDLIGKGGATAAQLQSLAEDLLSTSKANREGLVRLVRYEVDRALGKLGLATAEEVAELNNRIRNLETQVRAAAAGQPPAAPTPTPTPTAAATDPTGTDAAAGGAAAPAAEPTAGTRTVTPTQTTAGRASAAKQTTQRTAKKTAKKTVKKAVKKAAPRKAAE